jgi:hypothetical protein
MKNSHSKRERSEEARHDIPAEHHARVMELSKAEDLADMAMAHNKIKYDELLKAGDFEGAYACKRTHQPALIKKAEEAQKALWEFLGEVIPEVKDGDECWSLDPDEMYVGPHEHRGNSMSALSAMFGRG